MLLLPNWAYKLLLPALFVCDRPNISQALTLLYVLFKDGLGVNVPVWLFKPMSEADITSDDDDENCIGSEDVTDVESTDDDEDDENCIDSEDVTDGESGEDEALRSSALQADLLNKAKTANLAPVLSHKKRSAGAYTDWSQPYNKERMTR